MSADPAVIGEETICLGGLEESVGFLLRVSQVQNYEKFFVTFEDIGLRPGEFSALWVIRRNPGIRQGQLAEALSIKPPRMTKMIRRLEDQGRVKRVIPDNNRRCVRLFLTKTGEDFTAAHGQAFFGHDDEFHGLSEYERRQLTRLLRAYSGIKVLEEER